MKLYPFSAQHNAHNIELVCNMARNRDDDELWNKATDILHAITVSCTDGKVAWLTGKQLFIANELSAMGVTNRDALNAMTEEEADRLDEEQEEFLNQQFYQEYV